MSQPRPQAVRSRPLKRKKPLVRLLRRAGLCLITLIIISAGGLYAAMALLSRGPSQAAGDIFVTSVTETSALKFLARLFYSPAEIDEILERNSLVTFEEENDTSLVVFQPQTDETDEADIPDAPDIQTIDIKGGTYYGYMMIVRDPSRVFVGTCTKNFTTPSGGKSVGEISKRYSAVGGINGGAFEDKYGQGTGGIPDGIVISQGAVKWSKINDRKLCNTLIGITKDHKLYISKKLDAQAAIKKGVRDAVTFGPALILNGEPATIRGASSGMNPRTCIGQRADGAMLLLMINGRRPNSLGATLTDLIDVMMEHGAVNAANLDGGASSSIYIDGKYLNPNPMTVGMRDVPTAFIVR